MFLADHQTSGTVFVICTGNNLSVLPKPDHLVDYQTKYILGNPYKSESGWYCAEYKRTIPNIVALRLCGLEI